MVAVTLNLPTLRGTPMTRTFAALLALGLGLALLPPASLTAQNDADETAQVQAPANTNGYRGPLPDYFGKLGVGDEQRGKLYAVDAEYAGRIEALHKQIAELEKERDARLEELLTPGQKLRLKELREEAARRAAARQADQQPAAPDAARAAP
jgi:Spy/CpxP family protein refolding chaperone